MNVFHLAAPAEQVADHLRECITRRVWQGEMPGAPGLAKLLDVDHRTVIAAFSLLEKQGILVNQGAGKPRSIVLSDKFAPPALRIHVLLYEDWDRQQAHLINLVHYLNEMGHTTTLSSKTLVELNMDVSKVIRYAERIQTDAWIVFCGSKEVLEWFASRPTPAFAYAGRRRDVPIASIGPDKAPALRTAIRHLYELGHRRIVMMAREDRRKPQPGLLERLFLEELRSLGIRTGPYNLPDWKNNKQDFHRCIDALLKHTPPTAIILDEMQMFIAAQQHLGHLNIIAPRDISLMCCDPHRAFDWCSPSVSHIRWEPEPLVRRMVAWADNIARGHEDCKIGFTKAEFIAGGTIGPVAN